MNNKFLVTFFIIMSTLISKGQEVLENKIKLINKENFDNFSFFHIYELTNVYIKTSLHIINIKFIYKTAINLV